MVGWRAALREHPDARVFLDTSGANFGQTATANLQTADLGAVGDVGPSTAFLRAFMDARSGFLSDTDAEQVDFSRAFRLSDSPNG